MECYPRGVTVPADCCILKSLIIIDYNVTAGSPSMKGMLRVMPALVADGWNVTVWSHLFDSPDAKIQWKKFPGIPGPGLVKFLGFSVMVHWQWMKAVLRQRDAPAILWQSTGTYLLPADVICIHFISSFYLRKMKERSMRLPFGEMVMHGLVWVLEKIQQNLRRAGRQWFVVSKNLADDLKGQVRHADGFRLLPNSYDVTRWNCGIRAAASSSAREELGIKPGEVVFAFVGLGSFLRKGLPMALQVCALLAAKGLPVKLLVIGGATEEAPDLKDFAAGHGVTDLGFLITRGRTREVPRLLSACQGLLFPSVFEAFSLVEIEAAALGLRLYLTPHYGSEMLLKDGINGRLLPWDAEAASTLIEEDIVSGAVFNSAVFDENALLSDEAYGKLYVNLLNDAWTQRYPDQ